MTVQALREVRLYGALGREFGRVHRLAVLTPAEAVQALCAVLPGFQRAFLGRLGQAYARYHVFIGRGERRQAIGADEISEPVGATEPIRIVPVIEGAKRAGVFQQIVGVILVAYGIYEGDPAIAQYGYALIVQGSIQYFSSRPTPKTDSKPDNLPSYGFDGGALNASQQGLPVPLLFGRMIVGSTVISGGLSTDDFVLPVPAPLPPQTLPPHQPPDPFQWNEA